MRSGEESLHALCGRLIDYAGVFPPAALSLPEAVSLYLKYRESSDSWLLGRFICPSAALERLISLTKGPPLELSLLVGARVSASRFLEDLEQDLLELSKSSSVVSNAISIQAIELKIPAETIFAQEDEQLLELVKGVGERVSLLTGALPDKNPLPTYIEVAFTGGQRNAPRAAEAIDRTLRAISETIHSPASPYKTLAFKFRCGGATAHDIPDDEQILSVLRLSHSYKVPLKFTGGLHHPIRFEVAEPGEFPQHGFLNLFIAGALLHHRPLDDIQLLELIKTTDQSSFKFRASTLTWRDHTISTAQIFAARTQSIHSFGSCSFQEPLDYLRLI